MTLLRQGDAGQAEGERFHEERIPRRGLLGMTVPPITIRESLVTNFRFAIHEPLMC